MKKKKFSKRTKIFFTLSILWTVFILWNASRTGEQSRVLSDGITESIKQNIEQTDKVPAIFEGTEAIYSNAPAEEEKDEVFVNAYQMKIFVRKSGHLLEYTFLSFLVAFTFISHGFKVDSSFFFSILSGVMVAASDETIQSFTDGRSGKLSDVLLDTCGCIMGAFFAFLFVMIYLFIKSRFKKDKNDEICKKISETD